MPLEKTGIVHSNCEAAYSFELATCSDPGCGMHLLCKRQTGEYICEVIIGRDQLGELAGALLELRKEKQQ
jgi:hypothetical protein